MKLAVEVEVEIVDLKVPDQWHTLLHRLWSKAVGAPGYVKTEWIELENILFQAAAKSLPRKKPGLPPDHPLCGVCE